MVCVCACFFWLGCVFVWLRFVCVVCGVCGVCLVVWCVSGGVVCVCVWFLCVVGVCGCCFFPCFFDEMFENVEILKNGKNFENFDVRLKPYNFD